MDLTSVHLHLTAQRLRMDVISSNIANADTTRAKFVDGKWVPYTRKLVAFETKSQPSFAQSLQFSDGRWNWRRCKGK